MKRSTQVRIASVIAAIALVATAVTPAYAATFNVVGSTTLQPLAQLWATAYNKAHAWHISVSGGGSGAGVTAIQNSTAAIGMSSASPVSGLTYTAVARDAVIVVVNPKNAMYKITQAQVKAIYTGKILNWRQLNKSYPSHAIDLIGRTGASGTYAYFKTAMLGGSKQSARTRTLSSNGMVRSAVSADRYAIGYLAMSYKTSKVKALNMPSSPGATSGYVVPTKNTALKGSYPYVRYLYFITKSAPSGDVKLFMDWCLSASGQKYTAADYLPLH